MDDVERLRKIINVTLTINETYDNLEVVLQKILSSLEFVLDCEAVSYMEYDVHECEIICRVASGTYAQQMSGLKFLKKQSSIAYKVLQSKKAIMINTQEDIRKIIIDDALYNHYKNIDTILAFPLCDNNKHCFGVLEAYNKKNNTNFTREDFHIFTLLSQQIEQSIYNASYVNLLKKRIEKVYDKAYSSFEIVYASKEMDVKLKLAEKISQSEAPVLITGENGVGKRLLALQIHKWNATTPYALPITTLCQDIVKKTRDNSDSLHAMLFGANKQNSHNGILSQPGCETIILSEVSVLPLKIQEAILQYLKYKLIFYGNEKIHANNKHRIIFTSSNDLETMVSEKTFLEELYFHINALHINVSALHKRPDDVVAIAKHYFQKYIMKLQKNIEYIDPDVFVLLKKYGWPHSVQELIEVIYRSVLYCNSNAITCNDIVFHSNVKFRDADDVLKYKKTLKEAVDSFKKQYIYYALINNNWSCTKTARKLQIQRSYLSRLVKNFNLKNIKNTGIV